MMDPDVKAFLLLIVNTLSWVMIWLMVNMTIGIYFGYAFFEGSPSTGNIIYGIFLLVSFILLFRLIRKKWKGFREIGEE